MGLFRRPDVGVDVVGPIIAVVAQDMPAWLAPHKPGLIPTGILVAEVPDLRIATLAGSTMADLPFIGPILSRVVYPGPERDPLAAIDSGYGICFTLAGEDIVLIASAFRRFWKYSFAAFRFIPLRGIMAL